MKLIITDKELIEIFNQKLSQKKAKYNLKMTKLKVKTSAHVNVEVVTSENKYWIDRIYTEGNGDMANFEIILEGEFEKE